MIFRMTVDGVLGKFAKAVKELDVVATQQLQTAAEATARAAKAEEEGRAARAEYLRAATARDNIRALIGA
jgi:hypothetical protein